MRRGQISYNKIKCPVCDGWGERDVWPRATSSDLAPTRVACVACKGTGVFSYELHFSKQEEV